MMFCSEVSDMVQILTFYVIMKRIFSMSSSDAWSLSNYAQYLWEFKTQKQPLTTRLEHRTNICVWSCQLKHLCPYLSEQKVR